MAHGVRNALRTAIFGAIGIALMGAPPVHGAGDEQTLPAKTGSADATSRRTALVPLYVSFGTLQALDVDSTYRVLHQGGREANPIAANFVHSPAALIGFKAATAAGAIALVEGVRKRSPKTATLLMIGFNSAMAAVVAHNYAVASR